ncbi:uncharacterized protein LOC129774210 [Toxorhynchites rutilus septentrionalis]|uniref:uncharacterized protein LOC129774210 n=1 Tax=Toxorhynchites rutilus septentrionalis TaxID=329112 RepID=UPI00247A1DC9|nr:uncharacterized protein LOC129774210 [Toxorhynchites rutilus septentrionalis]
MYEIYGNDGLLVTEFCRRYNCSVELIIDEINQFGTIHPNKTGNGILGNLVERRADIGFGGLSSWHGPLKYLSFSKPIQRDSVTCLTPKPRNASLRTVPIFGPSIDTKDDLAQSDLTWWQTHEAWVFSLILSENPTIKKLVSNFRSGSPSVLQELADQGNVAFAIGRLNKDHLLLGEWFTARNIHEYQVMREDLYEEYEISMATKTWPLMEQFDTLTMRTEEATIRYYQELNAIYESSDYDVQTAATNSRLQEPYTPHALNKDDLLGGFFIVCLGSIVAVIVFAIELSPIKTKSSK